MAQKTSNRFSRGRVAQLVEHHNGIVGVIGSIPFASTILEVIESNSKFFNQTHLIEPNKISHLHF
jgi:hypothetical protein